MDKIIKGTVVTISTDGTQGVLEEDAVSPEQEVLVRFGKEYSYLFGGGFSFDEDAAVRMFPASVLQPETDFTPVNRATRLFGPNWHHVSTLKEPFDLAAGRVCQREACQATATRRILVNIWGTVCEYEACDACAMRWHGKLVDDFPAKKRAA